MRMTTAIAMALALAAAGCGNEGLSSSSAPVAAAPADEVPRLLTPSVTFEGQTYYLCSLGDPGAKTLPPELRLAFTATLKADGPGYSKEPTHDFLLRLVGEEPNRRVVEAVELPLGSKHLADLDGDGTTELFTSTWTPGRRLHGARAPRLPSGASLRYSNGKTYCKSSFGGPTVVAYRIDGPITLLFEDATAGGVTGYSSVSQIDAEGHPIGHPTSTDGFFQPLWADLFGDGRPVRCQVLTLKHTHHPPKGEPYVTYERKLYNYWAADPATGQWRQVADGRDIPIEAAPPLETQKLKGLLKAAPSGTAK
jgi:hypothetical protein